jgi:hypothetical protein
MKNPHAEEAGASNKLLCSSNACTPEPILAQRAKLSRSAKSAHRQRGGHER